MVNEVNAKHGGSATIILKYFEPGHTFMSADSFHHQVEQGMRKLKKVEDFEDFVGIVNKCGQAVVMKYDDFFQIPRGVSTAKYAKNKPKLEVIQVVKFVRGSEKMFWKTSHNQTDLQSALFLQKKYAKDIGNDFQCNDRTRGVYSEKKENIVKLLCPHMKIQRQTFWYELVINDTSVDLITERDPSENNGEAQDD